MKTMEGCKKVWPYVVTYKFEIILLFVLYILLGWGYPAAKEYLRPEFIQDFALFLVFQGLPGSVYVWYMVRRNKRNKEAGDDAQLS